MAGMNAALTASGVWHRYSRRGSWALADADVAIPSGCLTALVGPNGAGKTTLMRCWLGFERPTRGEVSVLGHDPAKHRTQAVTALGHVAQDPAFYGSLTCRDHIAFACLQRPGYDPRPSERVLGAAGVRLDAPARTLSGGQRVQLGLALAAGTRARALILDEPLANLDPLARREAMVWLAGLARDEDACVLVSSHLVSDLEGTFERIVIMGNGRVLLSASVDDAIGRFFVRSVGPDGPPGPAEVGRYRGRDGDLRALVDSSADPGVPDRATTLEDVVLGLLASAKATASAAIS